MEKTKKKKVKKIKPPPTLQNKPGKGICPVHGKVKPKWDKCKLWYACPSCGARIKIEEKAIYN